MKATIVYDLDKQQDHQKLLMAMRAKDYIDFIECVGKELTFLLDEGKDLSTAVHRFNDMLISSGLFDLDDNQGEKPLI